MSLLLRSPYFSQVIPMREVLPYRYQPRNPEKVFYFCHLCHKKLHVGEAFTLLAVVAKGVAVEHWPPAQVALNRPKLPT